MDKLIAWDLEGLQVLLPEVLDDARQFVKVSEFARGAMRNGSMLLAALKMRAGKHEEAEHLLDAVEAQQNTEELEGQFRTKLRIKLMRKRPKDPCVATMALIEDLYRYRLLHLMTDLTPLTDDLDKILVLVDDLPDSWVPFELDLAAQLWLGVLARIRGDLAKADELLSSVISETDKKENRADLEQIPCLYHVYVAFVEVTCLRMEQGDWPSARRCRKGGLQAMHKEVERTAPMVAKEMASSGWLGLGGFTGGLKKLLIPPVHPLHPNCPLFFWQVQNLLDAANRELSARLEVQDSSGEEWYSDQGEIDDVDDQVFHSGTEDSRGLEAPSPARAAAAGYQH